MLCNMSDGMSSRGGDFSTTPGAPMLAGAYVGGLGANLAWVLSERSFQNNAG